MLTEEDYGDIIESDEESWSENKDCLIDRSMDDESGMETGIPGVVSP